MKYIKPEIIIENIENLNLIMSSNQFIPEDKPQTHICGCKGGFNCECDCDFDCKSPNSHGQGGHACLHY